MLETSFYKLDAQNEFPRATRTLRYGSIASTLANRVTYWIIGALAG